MPFVAEFTTNGPSPESGRRQGSGVSTAVHPSQLHEMATAQVRLRRVAAISTEMSNAWLYYASICSAAKRRPSGMTASPRPLVRVRTRRPGFARQRPFV
jgi:hypothetical protein